MTKELGKTEAEMLQTVRVIEMYLPTMPTDMLQRWAGILNTALVKIDQELASTLMHHCTACGFEEYGYRDLLPVGWRSKYDTYICFNHTEKEVDGWLQKPAEIEVADPGETLEDLMALL
jgi:hypothetical protein